MTEVISSNRSFEEQIQNVWKGSGYLRVSVAHRSRSCTYLNRVRRDLEADHSRIVEIPDEWLEHEMFEELGTCHTCWPERERR